MELKCKCGTVVLGVDTNHAANRMRCACNSCRGYSKWLGEDDRLDEFGAVEIYQTIPNAVAIRSGQGALAAHLIAEKGPARWYCTACKTHMATTLQKPKLAFIGLPLKRSMQSPNAPELGPFMGYVNGKYAPENEPKPATSFPLAMLKILWRSLRAPKSSDWQNGQEWIVTPEPLSAEERSKLYEMAKTC